MSYWTKLKVPLIEGSQSRAINLNKTLTSGRKPPKIENWAAKKGLRNTKENSQQKFGILRGKQ